MDKEETVVVSALDSDLPVTGPFTVTWRNLSYKVKPSSFTKLMAKLSQTAAPQNKTVLSELYGQIASGELTALMGK